MRPLQAKWVRLTIVVSLLSLRAVLFISCLLFTLSTERFQWTRKQFADNSSCNKCSFTLEKFLFSIIGMGYWNGRLLPKYCITHVQRFKLYCVISNKIIPEIFIIFTRIYESNTQTIMPYLRPSYVFFSFKTMILNV